MFVLATPIVDWNAMWKIFVVALAAGAGVVIAFGFLLLGVKIANRSGSAGSGGSRLGGYTLAGVCGVLCLGVVVIGVYAMTKKPSSKRAKPKAKSALIVPAHPQTRLIASSG
jgi:hypothetical protein